MKECKFFVFVLVLMLIPATVFAQGKGKAHGSATKAFNQEQRHAKQEFMKAEKRTQEEKKQFQEQRREQKRNFLNERDAEPEPITGD